MEAETFHLSLSIKVKINLESKKKEKLCLLPKTPKGHLKAALFVKKICSVFFANGWKQNVSQSFKTFENNDLQLFSRWYHP